MPAKKSTKSRARSMSLPSQPTTDEVECIAVLEGDEWVTRCFPKPRGGVRAMLKRLGNPETKGKAVSRKKLPKGAKLA